MGFPVKTEAAPGPVKATLAQARPGLASPAPGRLPPAHRKSRRHDLRKRHGMTRIRPASIRANADTRGRLVAHAWRRRAMRIPQPCRCPLRSTAVDRNAGAACESAADQAFAGRVVLRAGDLPSGWQVFPRLVDEDAAAGFGACLVGRVGLAVTAEASSQAAGWGPGEPRCRSRRYGEIAVGWPCGESRPPPGRGGSGTVASPVLPAVLRAKVLDWAMRLQLRQRRRFGSYRGVTCAFPMWE